MPRSVAEPIKLAATPSYRDTYRTKIVTDPFSVPIEQKLELLRAVAAEARKVAGVFSVMGSIDARLEDRFFVSTEGSVIEQHVYQISPEFTATAVEAGRKVKSRTYRPHAVCAGYEAVERADMLGHARRIGEEAVAHLKAPSVSPGVMDLVLLPTHLGADDPRVDRPLHRARSRPRLRGQLRRHVVPDDRQAGQVPRRLRDRQLQRRPHPAREPLDLRLRRRRREDPPVPDHQGGDLRRLPDDPRPGPPDRPDRVDGLLLRRLVCLGAVPAHAQRLARAVGQAGDARRPGRRASRTAS